MTQRYGYEDDVLKKHHQLSPSSSACRRHSQVVSVLHPGESLPRQQGLKSFGYVSSPLRLKGRNRRSLSIGFNKGLCEVAPTKFIDKEIECSHLLVCWAAMARWLSLSFIMLLFLLLPLQLSRFWYRTSCRVAALFVSNFKSSGYLFVVLWTDWNQFYLIISCHNWMFLLQFIVILHECIC